MIVQRTAVFPASRETVFRKLRQPETLRYIARPFASFEPVGETQTVWTEGRTYAYRLRLFGFIPFGTHTIRIIRFDPDGIGSAEGNRFVPVWNHSISLTALGVGRTRYTDRVEIRAGWKTIFVWLWANAFYAHRQRKWIRFLNSTEENGST